MVGKRNGSGNRVKNVLEHIISFRTISAWGGRKLFEQHFLCGADTKVDEHFSKNGVVRIIVVSIAIQVGSPNFNTVHYPGASGRPGYVMYKTVIGIRRNIEACKALCLHTSIINPVI